MLALSQSYSDRAQLKRFFAPQAFISSPPIQGVAGGFPWSANNPRLMPVLFWSHKPHKGERLRLDNEGRRKLWRNGTSEQKRRSGGSEPSSFGFPSEDARPIGSTSASRTMCGADRD